MSLTYATANTLLNNTKKWTNMRSKTTPPPGSWTYSFSPVGSITVTGSPTTWIFNKTGATNNLWDTSVWATTGADSGQCVWNNALAGTGSLRGGLLFGVSLTPGTGGNNYTNQRLGVYIPATSGNLQTYSGSGTVGASFAYTVTSTTEFKFVWTTTLITFYVDGVSKGTQTKTAGQLLYPWCSFYTQQSTARIASYL